MYKPARIREFTTPAIHKKASTQTVNGRTQKTYEAVGKVRGKFKQKSAEEMTANGLIVSSDKITFVTWYKPDFAAADILTIGGVDYEIVGTPENVEMRGRYAVLTLERIGGGA